MFMEGNKTRLLKQLKEEMLGSLPGNRVRKSGQCCETRSRCWKTSIAGVSLTPTSSPKCSTLTPRKGSTDCGRFSSYPRRHGASEGIDIAHLAGGQTVASLVQFIDGLPFKPGYRRYKIRHVDGVDDFGSIHEVVARRYRRLLDEGDVFPDVILIDGGRGQLNAALAAFEQNKIVPPTVIGLAKREEEIYVPELPEPLRVSRHAFALRLLQYVRDEAHRFAQHYHHILRRKPRSKSSPTHEPTQWMCSTTPSVKIR